MKNSCKFLALSHANDAGWLKLSEIGEMMVVDLVILKAMDILIRGP